MNKIEHLLVCVMEEAAEVQQATSKALRFSLGDHHPEHPPVMEMIRREFGDLCAVVEMLKDEGVNLMQLDREAMDVKKSKVRQMMKYAVEKGALQI